jgi:hypothetical protein
VKKKKKLRRWKRRRLVKGHNDEVQEGFMFFIFNKDMIFL